MNNRRTYEGDRAAKPRRVRHGVRLGGDTLPEGPLAARWRRGVETDALVTVMDEAIAYARAGQVASLDLAPGGIRARVQGRAARPHEVRLTIGTFSRTEWDAIAAAMAGEAVHGAKLLAGELPDGIDALLETLGLSLLPVSPERIGIRCTCGAASPCKHALAASLLVARALDVEPLRILELRGMAAPRLLERLRQTRALHTHGVAVAHADPALPPELADPPPLEPSDRFWRGDGTAESHADPHTYAEHALLRRLGPSPLQGRFPMVGLLASIYDTVSELALHLRDRAEKLE